MITHISGSKLDNLWIEIEREKGKMKVAVVLGDMNYIKMASRFCCFCDTNPF